MNFINKFINQVNIWQVNRLIFDDFLKYRYITWIKNVDHKYISYVITLCEFCDICRGGYINVIKWLWNQYHMNGIHGVIETYAGSDINFITYMVSMDRFDIYVEKGKIFESVCYHGYLNIAKWLWNLDEKINMHIDYKFLFINACTDHNLNIAKWLLNLGEGIDIDNLKSELLEITKEDIKKMLQIEKKGTKYVSSLVLDERREPPYSKFYPFFP